MGAASVSRSALASLRYAGVSMIDRRNDKGVGQDATTSQQTFHSGLQRPAAWRALGRLQGPSCTKRALHEEVEDRAGFVKSGYMGCTSIHVTRSLACMRASCKTCTAEGCSLGWLCSTYGQGVVGGVVYKRLQMSVDLLRVLAATEPKMYRSSKSDHTTLAHWSHT